MAVGRWNISSSLSFLKVNDIAVKYDLSDHPWNQMYGSIVQPQFPEPNAVSLWVPSLYWCWCHLQDIRALSTWLGIWNSDRATISRKLLAYLIPQHTPLIKQDIIFLKIPLNLELLQDTMQLKHKSRLSRAVMAHTFNLSSLEAEAGRRKLGTILL